MMEGHEIDKWQQPDIADFVRQLVDKWGPEPHEYGKLTNLFDVLDAQRKSGLLHQDKLSVLWEMFGEAMTPKTMQGFVARKPHGYAGDYEVIDKIYTQKVSHDIRFSKWDFFFQGTSACRAVRNRKQYFIELLAETVQKNENTKILNVGSGPGRDVYDFFCLYPEAIVSIDCIDLDVNAIAFSDTLCQDYKDRISFSNRNIFRFRTMKRYDLVWSAGLFDYLDDRLFKHLLTHLYSLVAGNGQLVIGNFSEANPSRAYMEFGEWLLLHRKSEKLKALAEECGIDPNMIKVGSEPEGVNLFLHVEKS
ncbi:MAG: class I SAM-dependent methyltransferase [Deltaproteobacteria bacterium]|nr:class I SAM-dependent methyltransferase [Deltaproteobacteria bacterium]